MKRLVAILTLLLLTASLTHACTCFYDSRPASVRLLEAKSLNYTIFYGRVVHVKDAGAIIIRLKVKKSWTPDLPSYVTITTNPGGGMCGYPLATNRNYLVIASKDKDEDGLSISHCGLTGLTTEGFPAEYQKALGPEYIAPKFPEQPSQKSSGRPDYAVLWWKYGIASWLITFAVLKLCRLRKHRS